jgi:hypothetical protein
VPLDGRVMLRLTEGEGSAQVDHAEGRFVFLRAFSDDVEVPLRVGSLRVYRLPAARRQLFQAEPAPEPEPQPAPEPAPQPRPAPALNETVVRAIARLRNLTKDSCLAAQREDHEAARRDRTRAALLWGSLEPDVFNGTGANGSWACWDCMRNRPGSCLHFFAWTPPPPSEAKLRRRRELQAEQQKAHRRRSLEQLMGKSCCRVHRATGAKDCSPSYCVEAVKQHAHARMAHTLRRLHDAGKREETKLSVVQLVATDVLSPRTAHPHAPCKKGDLHAGSAECLAESMIHHALGAHGATREQVDEHLSKVGVTLGSAVARMLGATRQTAAAAPSWRSDPQRAAAAAKAGRPRRRAQQGAPRRAARHEQASREERARLREASSWLNASAHHASALVRAGERNAASRGHLPAQGVLSASVDAMARVFTSPDSLLGRSVAAGRALTEVLARRPALAGPPRPPRPRPHRRLIASFYDHVDAAEGRRLAAGSPGGGFDLPVRPSWIHRVDWPAAVHELHRVAGVLQTRTKHVHDHVRRLGQLPHGELLDRHKTGWSLLDINVVPTSVGNGFRRLHAYMHGRAHDRDLHYQTRTLPRATDSSHRQAAADALLHGEGFFAAAQNHLEHSNSHHRSRARRLADSFFEAAQALPVTASAIRSAFAIDALVDDEGAPLLDSGGRPVRGFAKSGASDGGVEFVRWLVEGAQDPAAPPGGLAVHPRCCARRRHPALLPVRPARRGGGARVRRRDGHQDAPVAPPLLARDRGAARQAAAVPRGARPGRRVEVERLGVRVGLQLGGGQGRARVAGGAGAVERGALRADPARRGGRRRAEQHCAHGRRGAGRPSARLRAGVRHRAAGGAAVHHHGHLGRAALLRVRAPGQRSLHGLLAHLQTPARRADEARAPGGPCARPRRKGGVAAGARRRRRRAASAGRPAGRSAGHHPASRRAAPPRPPARRDPAHSYRAVRADPAVRARELAAGRRRLSPAQIIWKNVRIL